MMDLSSGKQDIYGFGTAYGNIKTVSYGNTLSAEMHHLTKR